jgi:sugar phosphate isomerase/epimerase
MPDIYLATVLLEKNRWSSRVPSITLAEWLPRIKEAGFDGVELWENHVLDRPEALAYITDGGCRPVKVFNTYLTFADDAPERIDAVAGAITALKAPAVKFNVNGGCTLDQHREQLLAFAERLPSGCRMLCECHGGTPLEDLTVAAAFLDSLPSERFGAILHGFGEPGDVLARYNTLKRHVAHIHVQTRGDEKTDGSFEANAKNLRDAGFTGGWSIEFVKSTAQPDELIETAFKEACADLRDLRGVFA